MNTMNSMNAINTSNSALNKIAESITESANQIFDALHTWSTGFAGFGAKGENWLQNEYFDKVIKNIILIKRNLQDAKNYISQNNLEYKDVEVFVVWTQNTIDTINNLMLQDVYFNNTFGYAMEELIELSKELREEIVFEV